MSEVETKKKWTGEYDPAIAMQLAENSDARAGILSMLRGGAARQGTACIAIRGLMIRSSGSAIPGQFVSCRRKRAAWPGLRLKSSLKSQKARSRTV